MEDTASKTTTIDMSTVAQYRRIYHRMERMARVSFEISADSPVTPQQLAATFLDNEAGWSRETARLYRASLVYFFKQIGDIAATEACDMVYHVNEDGEWQMQLRERVSAERKKRKRSAPRTSAQKAKSMVPEDMVLLREALDTSQSMWARDTRLWFFAGVLTGLRPSEWQRAEITRNDAGALVLVVQNAKNSNGRAHGPKRSIGLGKMSESNVALIAAHLETVRRYTAMGSYEHLYHSCRRLLRNVADRLWPRRIKHPSLYTARHVFSADAKQQFDRIAVAALMGHASTDTAYEHYGKRHTGSGGMAVEPSDADMKAVAAKNPDYVAGQPTSEGAPASKFSQIYSVDNGAANNG